MLRKLSKYLSIISIFLFIGCRDANYLDKYTKQTRSDLKNSLIKSDKSPAESVGNQAPIPKLSNMLSFPKPPKFTQGNQIISFSVTDAVDLKDVLVELGRVTGLDVDIDPKISGGIILNAKNRPLSEIIDRICALGNLRYSFENGILTFSSDTYYNKHYVVDYLFDGSLWNEVTTNLTSVLANKTSEDSKVTGNKSAGIITVFSNDVGQKAVKEYLDEVRINASAQVLIEAKVVEVTLNDNFNAGIDWNFIKGATNINSNPPTPANFTPAITVGLAPFLTSNGNINIAALEEFGNVRAISSPRINSLNNQKATLNFIDKLVYFTLETSTSTAIQSVNAATVQSVIATKHEEPVGVQLEITPSIHLKDKEITLYVKPTLSIKSGEAKDPSVDADGKNLGNVVPIVQTRTINTTMKVHSGDILVIGGLMKEDATNSDSGIPFLSRIPILGYLFKFVSKTNKTVETVIFIKATIVQSNSGASKYDRELSDKFTATKRPF